MPFMNLTVIEKGAICILGPDNGEFFKPEYAQAARKQFAEAVKDLHGVDRPTLIVFEDPNGEKVPVKEQPVRQPSAFGSWITFGNGDVHVYHDGPMRSIVIGHNKDNRGKPEFPLAILMQENGDVSLQLPASGGEVPVQVDIDAQEFAGRLLEFLVSFVPPVFALPPMEVKPAEQSTDSLPA